MLWINISVNDAENQIKELTKSIKIESHGFPLPAIEIRDIVPGDILLLQIRQVVSIGGTHSRKREEPSVGRMKRTWARIKTNGKSDWSQTKASSAILAIAVLSANLKGNALLLEGKLRIKTNKPIPGNIVHYEG